MKQPERVAELLAELRALSENDFERHRIDVLERDLTAPPTAEVIDDDYQRFDGTLYRKRKPRQGQVGHYQQSIQIHQAVWRYYYGDIPAGCHIHHADGNTAKFTATDDFEVGISQMSNNYWNALTITLPAPQSGGGDNPDPSEPLPADRTATWDYSNADVMTETMALSAGTGTVKAIEDNGVLMTVISNGATFRNNGNNIQVRKGAEFRIPVQSTSDVVTIKGYPSYSYYSISGGEEITNSGIGTFFSFFGEAIPIYCVVLIQ